MQLVYLADTGYSVHCFKSPVMCANYTCRIFSVHPKNDTLKRQLYSNSEGLHNMDVETFERQKIATFLDQMRMQSSLILVLKNETIDTTDKVTITKTYLI